MLSNFFMQRYRHLLVIRRWQFHFSQKKILIQNGPTFKKHLARAVLGWSKSFYRLMAVTALMRCITFREDLACLNQRFGRGPLRARYR